MSMSMFSPPLPPGRYIVTVADDGATTTIPYHSTDRRRVQLAGGGVVEIDTHAEHGGHYVAIDTDGDAVPIPLVPLALEQTAAGLVGVEGTALIDGLARMVTLIDHVATGNVYAIGGVLGRIDADGDLYGAARRVAAERDALRSVRDTMATRAQRQADDIKAKAKAWRAYAGQLAAHIQHHDEVQTLHRCADEIDPIPTREPVIAAEGSGLRWRSGSITVEHPTAAAPVVAAEREPTEPLPAQPLVGGPDVECVMCGAPMYSGDSVVADSPVCKLHRIKRGSR